MSVLYLEGQVSSCPGKGEGWGCCRRSHEFETQGVLTSTPLGYKPGIGKIKLQRNPSWHIPSPDGSEMEQTLTGLQRQHMTSVCCQQIQGVLAHTAEEKFGGDRQDRWLLNKRSGCPLPIVNCQFHGSMASSEQPSRAAANQEERRGADNQATGIL